MACASYRIRFLPGTVEDDTEWELQITDPSTLQKYIFEVVKCYLDLEPFNPFTTNVKARFLVEALSRIDVSYRGINGVKTSEIAHSMWDVFLVLAKQIPVSSRRHYKLSMLIDEIIFVHQQVSFGRKVSLHA
jgi:hypothetical protein